MSPTTANGKICYLEIPANDIARSVAFYLGVFGWTTRTRADGSIAVDDGVGEVRGTEMTARFRDPGGNIFGLYQQPA